MLLASFLNLMAGRKKTDVLPRNRKVVQVCLSEPVVKELQEYADTEHNGQLSVAARELLSDVLIGVN